MLRITTSFSWPRLAKDVKAFVQECFTYLQSKTSTQKPLGLLQPLPIPVSVWEDISMDFITHLPPSHGKSVVWVIVDRLTKYAHFLALPAQFSAATLAPIFLSEIYKLHGMPKSIVSDRDRVFLSHFWRELFRLMGTTLAYSSTYHPQSDGQTEVTNRILETYLRYFVSDSPAAWTQFFPLAEYWYTSSYQSAIKMTPFEALYGRPPPNVRSYMAVSTTVAALDASLTTRHQKLQLLRENLTLAQMRMRSHANAHRQDRSFKVGDWVWLRLQPYRQQTVVRRETQKLAKRLSNCESHWEGCLCTSAGPTGSHTFCLSCLKAETILWFTTISCSALR